MSWITIVGMGALGSHAALFLRNYDLTVIDFDKVESKNVLAQMHSGMTLNRNKAASTVDLHDRIFQRLVTAKPVKLVKENIGLLQGLIIEATDNTATKRLVNDYALATKADCLHTAISADGSYAKVAWAEHFKVDDDQGLVGATCEDGENLPFHGLVGAQAAIAAQQFLKTGVKHSFYLVRGKVERFS